MIHITKEGFESLEYNNKLRQYVAEEFVSYHCLRDGVTEVEEGVTLEDIITFTARDEMLRLIVGAYSGCSVMDFYDELRKGVKPISPDAKIQYCTVALEVEITEATGQKPAKEIDSTLSFYGCSNNKETWALDLAPLAKIAALPFRLEANSTVASLGENSDEVETELKHTPKLLDLLDAIFFDLSFHGSPEEKAEHLSILEEAMQSLHNGTAKTRTLDFTVGAVYIAPLAHDGTAKTRPLNLPERKVDGE